MDLVRPMGRGWLCLAAACIAGCRTADRAVEPGDPTPRLGGTVAVGVPAPATTVLPPLAAVALDFELGGALYLGLNYGEWAEGGLVYRPEHPLGLARSWEQRGPRLTYRLDTRRRWSDGRPVRAADVAFTFGLLADTALALPLSSVTARIDSIRTPDDSTVIFHFDGEYPGMLFDTGVGILPEHVFGRVPRAALTGGLPLPEGLAPEAVPASGPFRLAEWRPRERVTLMRNESAASPARLDRLVVRVSPDESTRAAELRADAIQAAQFNSFRIVSSLEGVELLSIPQRGYDYIAWNPAAHEAFASRDVRAALSLAIDRETVIGALDMSRFAEPAWGPYGSLFGGLRSPPPGGVLHDPARARSLLDAAGWRDADGDGVRERGSARLSFELRVPAGNDRREDAAEIVQRQLARVGVEAVIRREDFNALFGRVMGGDYQAALLGWQVALDPDISTFWADPESPLNVVSFRDRAVAEAIGSALAQSDAASAAPHWRRAAALIADRYPYAFLWYFDIPFARRDRLRGVRVDVTGWGSGAGEWWIVPSDP